MISTLYQVMQFKAWEERHKWSSPHYIYNLLLYLYVLRWHAKELWDIMKRSTHYNKRFKLACYG